jgi:hypothetical protein
MKTSKMEVVKNAENEKLTLLQNVENCFREIGQNAKNYVYNTLTCYLANKTILKYQICIKSINFINRHIF